MVVAPQRGLAGHIAAGRERLYFTASATPPLNWRVLPSKERPTAQTGLPAARYGAEELQAPAKRILVRPFFRAAVDGPGVEGGEAVEEARPVGQDKKAAHGGSPRRVLVREESAHQAGEVLPDFVVGNAEGEIPPP